MSNQKKFLKDLSKPMDKEDIEKSKSVYELMPDYETIPEEFKHFNCPTKWNAFQSDWFFSGLENTDGLKPQKGIDKDAALTHLKVVQVSWESKHEHKTASVAYLASLWFKKNSKWVKRVRKPCCED